MILSQRHSSKNRSIASYIKRPDLLTIPRIQLPISRNQLKEHLMTFNKAHWNIIAILRPTIWQSSAPPTTIACRDSYLIILIPFRAKCLQCLIIEISWILSFRPRIYLIPRSLYIPRTEFPFLKMNQGHSRIWVKILRSTIKSAIALIANHIFYRIFPLFLNSTFHVWDWNAKEGFIHLNALPHPGHFHVPEMSYNSVSIFGWVKQPNKQRNHS